MLNQIRSILNYYKAFAMWSFGVTLIITFTRPEIILAVLTKLFLVTILWLLFSDRKIRRRLRFYKIAGVSNLKFFTIIFVLDCILTCSFLLLIKGFLN